MAIYRFLADAVLTIHFVYVAFVVLGMAAILAGVALGWRWVANFWFRTIHFLMIAIVVTESVCGVLCPLTEWEDSLREMAGEVNGPGSFLGRWLEKLLFVDMSAFAPWVLPACYCVLRTGRAVGDDSDAAAVACEEGDFSGGGSTAKVGWRAMIRENRIALGTRRRGPLAFVASG